MSLPLSPTPAESFGLSWEQLTARYEAWRAEPASVLAFASFLGEAQPWLEQALRGLSERHHLCVDLGQAMPAFQAALARMEALPPSPDAFLIWLESLGLKIVKEEAAADVVPIGVPDAPWHGFRRRFNAQTLESRLRLLQTLPPSSLMPSLSGESLAPDGEWVNLWEEVSSGFTASMLPSEWSRFLPADEDEEFDAPNIILGREREKTSLAPLGRWLLKAAVLEESSRNQESSISLTVPSWAVPSSPESFLREINSISKRMGGLPQTEGLDDLVGRLSHSLEFGNKSRIAQPSPLEILAFATLAGESSSKIEGLAGLIHLRQGKPEEARLAYTRLLNEATDRNGVATALANLGSIDLASPSGWQCADPLLREALKLNPWSALARQSMEIMTAWMRLSQVEDKK